MTAVASPPSLQPLPRLGWTSSGNGSQGGLDSMSPAEVSRMFARKTPQRTDSSGSLSSAASASSSTSTSTINSKDPKARQARSQGSDWGSQVSWSPQNNPESAALPEVPNGKPPVGPPSSLYNTQMAGLQQAAPMVPSQKNVQPPPQQQQQQQPANGVRMAPAPPNTSDPPALLVLLPMNGTFERKQINVPLFPEMLRIGRQTNARTVPTPTNGYFDSKVLSRQHAEVWADRNGKIWIRDVKSSNGTFVNGVRLSPESRDSEPHELRENDSLELGIDIVSEDQKSIVHHKVSAKVEHAGIHTNAASVLDLNIGDIDPGSNNGVMGPMYPQQLPMRGRGTSQGSVQSNGRIGMQGMPANMNGMGVQRHMNAWLTPISIEQVVKRLGNELKQAKQQASDLHRTTDFFNAVLTTQPGSAPPKPPQSILPHPPQVNGITSPQRSDPMSPFAGPPAPPPQQPLPEKPDAPRSIHADANLIHAIQRADTAKSLATMANSSPTKADPSASQILSLAEALQATRKELETQGNRVRHLEESLKQERRARETAEERSRHLLERSKAMSEEQNEKTPSIAQDGFEKSLSESDTASIAESTTSEKTLVPSEPTAETTSDSTTANAETITHLQENLTTVLREMSEMKTHMDEYRLDIENKEAENNHLMAMIVQLRKEQQALEHQEGKKTTARGTKSESRRSPSSGLPVMNGLANGVAASSEADKVANAVAEAIEASAAEPSVQEHGNPEQAKQMQQFQTAVAQAFANTHNDRYAQTAPYVSILGVVLIGVGLMTYLNGWPKGDH